MLIVKILLLTYTMLSTTVWIGRLVSKEEMCSLAIIAQVLATTGFIVLQWMS